MKLFTFSSLKKKTLDSYENNARTLDEMQKHQI